MEEEKKRVPYLGIAVAGILCVAAYFALVLFGSTRKTQVIELVTGEARFHVSMCDICETKLNEARELGNVPKFVPGEAKPFCLDKWQTLEQVKAEMKAEGFRPGTFDDLVGYYDTDPVLVEDRKVYSIATEWVSNPTSKPERWQYVRPHVSELHNSTVGMFKALGDESSRDFDESPQEVNSLSTNCVLGVKDTLR